MEMNYNNKSKSKIKSNEGVRRLQSPGKGQLSQWTQQSTVCTIGY